MKKNQKFASSMKIIGGLLTTGLLTVGVVNSPVITKTKNTNTNNKVQNTTLKSLKKVNDFNEATITPVNASDVFDGDSVTGQIGYQVDTEANEATGITLMPLTSDGDSTFAGTNLRLKTDFTIGGTGTYYVTTIGDETFEENANIVGTLDLSTLNGENKGITSIKDSAFEECTGITEIKLPSILSYIGKDCFSECTNMTAINLEDTAVSTVGEGAFEECRNLVSIAIPSTLTSIDKEVFEGCTSLKTLDFSRCKNTLQNILEGAFKGCTTLEGVSFDGLTVFTKVGQSAFEGCSNLHSLTFPAGSTFTTIEDDAFANCNLQISQINLNGNTAFSAETFKNGDQTVGYVIRPGTNAWDSTTVAAGSLAFGDIDFSNSKYTFTDFADKAFYGSNITSIKFQSGLIKIGENMCKGCTKLAKLDFSLCTATTGCSIGSNAFIGCDKLSSVDNVLVPFLTTCMFQKFELISNKLWNFGTAQWDGTGNAAGLLFGNLDCKTAGVSAISDNQFEGCCGITGLSTDNVAFAEIKSEAFKNCKNLTTVELGSTLTTIGDDAFEGCPITSITTGELSSLPLVYFYDGDTVVGGAIMGQEDKNATPTWGTDNVALGCLAYGKVVINGNDSFTTLAEDAFANCDGITSVVLNGLNEIGEEAFEKCDNLTSVSLGSVTKIGEGAFNECPKLTEITLSKNVTLVDNYAFGDCSSLTDITFENSNPDWMAWSSTATSNGNSGLSPQCFTGLVSKSQEGAITTGGITQIKNIHVPSGSESKYQKYFENNASQFGIWYTPGSINIVAEPSSNALALGLGIGLGGAALIGLIVALVIVAKKKKNKKATTKPATNKK